jgi:hypothetical protein
MIKNAVGELNYNYSQDKSLLTGNRENPALVLSKVRYPTKISQRLFDVRLYRPLHAYIPTLDDRTSG